MISNVKFNRFMPKFQQNLRKDLKKLFKRDRLIVFADKVETCIAQAQNPTKNNE